MAGGMTVEAVVGGVMPTVVVVFVEGSCRVRVEREILWYSSNTTGRGCDILDETTGASAIVAGLTSMAGGVRNKRGCCCTRGEACARRSSAFLSQCFLYTTEETCSKLALGLTARAVRGDGGGGVNHATRGRTSHWVRPTLDECSPDAGCHSPEGSVLPDRRAGKISC